MLRYPVPTPFTLISLPYLIIGYAFEVLIFWLMAKRNGIKFIGSLISVSIANALTAFLGLYVTFTDSFTSNVWWFLGMLVMSIIVEGGFYIAYFYKREIRNWKLILIAVLGNLLTFVIVGYGIFISPGLTEKYLPLLGIKFF